MKAAIKARLTGDSTLAALLTGGIYDTDDLPEDRLSLDYLSQLGKLSEHGEVLPTAVLTWGGETPQDMFRAESWVLNIWLYEQNGNSTIDAAIRRIKALLYQWIPASTANESVMKINFTSGGFEFIDPDLGDSNGRNIQYSLQVLRK